MRDVILFMTSRRHIHACEIKDQLDLCRKVLTDDYDAIRRVCKETVEDERRNGVKYFEMSLNPFTVLTEETPENVKNLVQSIIESLKNSCDSEEVDFGIILQVYSSMSEEKTSLILDLCKELEEVVGIELTLPYLFPQNETEDLIKPNDFDLFEQAKKLGIHRSVVISPLFPPKVVFESIENLGTDRIVLGYSVVQDKTLLADCIANRIHFCTIPLMSSKFSKIYLYH